MTVRLGHGMCTSLCHIMHRNLILTKTWAFAFLVNIAEHYGCRSFDESELLAPISTPAVSLCWSGTWLMVCRCMGSTCDWPDCTDGMGVWLIALWVWRFLFDNQLPTGSWCYCSNQVAMCGMGTLFFREHDFFRPSFKCWHFRGFLDHRGFKN